MSKRILGVFLLLLSLAAVPKTVQAIENDHTKPDIWAVGDRNTSAGYQNLVRFDHNGSLIPPNAMTVPQTVGESTHPYAVVYSSQIVVSSGILNIHEDFGLIQSSNVSLYGSFLVSTAQLANVGGGTTYAIVDLTQSTVPRNIVIQSSFTTGMSTTTLIGGATIYGTNNLGQVTQELIAISTTFGIGNTAWIQVTSVTIQTSSTSAGISIGTTTITIGTGNKIGISNNLSSSSDVYKISCSTGDIPISSATINTTFDTIDFSPTFPNGTREYHVWYKAKNSTP